MCDSLKPVLNTGKHVATLNQAEHLDRPLDTTFPGALSDSTVFMVLKIVIETDFRRM